jgi:hypothetical protein
MVEWWNGSMVEKRSTKEREMIAPGFSQPSSSIPKWHAHILRGVHDMFGYAVQEPRYSSLDFEPACSRVYPSRHITYYMVCICVSRLGPLSSHSPKDQVSRLSYQGQQDGSKQNAPPPESPDFTDRFDWNLGAPWSGVPIPRDSLRKSRKALD